MFLELFRKQLFSLLLFSHQVYTQDLLVTLDQEQQVFFEDVVSHLEVTSQLSLRRDASLLEEHRHTPSHLNMTQQQSPVPQSLLRFHIVSHVALIINASRVVTCPSPLAGPARDDEVLQLLVLDNLRDGADEALHDGSEPLLGDILFPEGLEEVVVPDE